MVPQISSVENLIGFSEGIHLSAYVRSKGTKDRDLQVQNIIDSFRHLANTQLSKDEIEEFLKPILNVLGHQEILDSLPESFVIFRARGFFRLYATDSSIRPMIIVSRSFHVKPLIESGLYLPSQENSVITLDSVLDKFRDDSDHVIRQNLFEVGRAAAEGRVRYLFFRKGFDLFGKFDPESGGITFSLGQMDHEDDCLLDDICQTVMKYGGQVRAIQGERLPGKLPMVAVLRRRQPVQMDTEPEWVNSPKIS